MDSSDESAVSAADGTTTTTTTTTTTGEGEDSAASAQAGVDEVAGADTDPAADPMSDAAGSADALPADVVAPAASEPTSVPEGPQTPDGQIALNKQVHSEPASSRPGTSGGRKNHGTPRNNYDRQSVLRSQPKTLRLEREPEADEPNVAATVWLNRVLPDPTPPSKRLKPAFALKLARISARNNVDWALTLAVLRSSGERGAVPATKTQLLTLAKELHARHSNRNAWTSVLALEGRTTFADRAVALQHLYRAVGLKALVKGFDWAKPSLSKRILKDRRITIYPGGRSDIQAGRVNIRVLVLMAYLAEAHGQLTVSCLISGHRLYARPGVVSAHIYGLAADLSVVGNTSIMGHSQPGGITEKAVRNILQLPSELQPRQLISLLGLGGPSFPLANHDDHIHVGY